MSKVSYAILLANLGTPDAATPAAVRAFLKPFLSDRRVVEIPKPLWSLILNGFILPFRPKPVAEKYQVLWGEYGDSPLRLITQQQVAKLQQQLGSSILVDYVFSYGEPSLAKQLDKYRQLAEKVIILPLYPQYSATTTAALNDQLAQYQLKQRYIADVQFIREYYQAPSFTHALADSVQQFWQQQGQGDFLLASYHGVPQKYVEKGDPYQQQCLATTQALKQALNVPAERIATSFQSRLGKAPWLQPYTDVTVKALAQQGIKTLDVVCPSFSVDCLETLEEIQIENREYFKAAGGQELRLIPCLNASDAHIQMMLAVLRPYLADALTLTETA